MEGRLDVVDCDDVLRVARFWSTVLARPLDKGSGALFASIGGTDGERREPAWHFTKVPEPERGKNRVHLDLVSPQPSAVEDLVGLGATVIAEHRMPDAGCRMPDCDSRSGGKRILYSSQEFHRLGLGSAECLRR